MANSRERPRACPWFDGKGASSALREEQGSVKCGSWEHPATSCVCMAYKLRMEFPFVNG